MSYRATLIPGDGIGPEIVEATVRVLASTGVDIEWERRAAGAAAQTAEGSPLPASTVESLRRNRLGLKGPLIVERGSPPLELPDGRVFATPNAGLRGVCDAYANVRPCRLFPGVPSRFRGVNVDLIVVREVSEGIYIGRERMVDEQTAEATLLTTRAASERIARFGFELAHKLGRKRVTAVHKANVLDKTDGLFLRTFHEAAADYPDIASDDRMIDAAAAQLVTSPDSFDVIVAPNQYGDILSDLAAAIVGGLGLGPGANYGDEIALFEACHGAAPDIAGRNRANPLALILSGAMLLDHVGEDAAGERVRQAVADFLAAGRGLTPDLGGDGTTAGVADALVRLVEERS